MIGIFQQNGVNLFNEVSEILRTQLNLSSHLAQSFAIPNQAFNVLRNQYNAEKIINQVVEDSRGQYEMRLIIVDVDIYAPRMNFIFGQADPVTKTAIVSTYRFANIKTSERLTKEVVHEICHLLGLGHCANPQCVMHFSNTIEDTDQKQTKLCAECRRKIEAL